MYDQYDSGICLVEDDPIMGESLSEFFELEDLPCDWFRTLGSARRALGRHHYCALVSDIRLPDGDGGDLYVEMARRGEPLPPTLFITAYGSVDQAVELLKQGAQDYVTKPFEPDELVLKLRRACPALLKSGMSKQGRHFLGVSPAMQSIEQMLERVATYRVPVLITGESGVGKEYAARYLHRCRDSARKAPFVAMNCAAVPQELIESELFGAERGAFTGAASRRRGLFEQAEDGTLFLDEVGDMPLNMQAKLLRAVQERTIRRVGGVRDIPVHAQLVWATNCELKARVSDGRFREDLYFRISTVNLEIPPLRERIEDILWFADMFLEVFARENGRNFRLTPAAQRYLESQSWPGNVRELHQTVERAAIFSEPGVLEPVSFQSPAILKSRPDISAAPGLRDYLAACEDWYVRQALERCGGRIGDAAHLLGISRKNLWERMNRLGIGRSGPRRGQERPGVIG